MQGAERRKNIVSALLSATKPISASKLAKDFGVSRQIIVGDVALIRTQGEYEIQSTSRGYIIPKPFDGIIKSFVSKHSERDIEEELETIVSLGGEVIDVSIEHPVYGAIKANLHVTSTAEIQEFVALSRKYKAHPLSEITDGIHTHSVLVKDEAHFERILDALRAKGFLFE